MTFPSRCFLWASQTGTPPLVYSRRRKPEHCITDSVNKRHAHSASNTVSCLEIIVEHTLELRVHCTKNDDKRGENDIAEDEVDQIRIGLIVEPISDD